MANNAQKTPLAQTLNEFAASKIAGALQLTGKSLPCSIVSIAGWIATVKFEVDAAPFTLPNVTVPVASSLYDYLPLQKGDPGIVRAADARLGALSELGGSTPPIGGAANLATLVFEPFGKKSYAAPSDPKVRVVQGPNGVTIQDLATNSTIVLTKTGITLTRGNAVVTMTDASVVVACGGNNVTVDSSGIEINGTLTINGKAYLAHEHGGVQAGGSFSGGVHDP